MYIDAFKLLGIHDKIPYDENDITYCLKLLRNNKNIAIVTYSTYYQKLINFDKTKLNNPDIYVKYCEDIRLLMCARMLAYDKPIPIIN